ncbi:MAG: hypothetical protein HYZ90_01095 [Candidatus Omnitrophica bacterium]|nr:hypothetical protein [Candidatus Omnitrophota bacterium]
MGCLCLALGLGAFAAANGRGQWLRPGWGKPSAQRPLYESWNAFSRVTVLPRSSRNPFCWGIDRALLRQAKPVDELRLEIDAGASTPLISFDGDLERVGYLRYDITGFAHYLRPRANTFIIGSGGGKDVLTALLFGQPRILAVEVNPDVVKAAHGVFGGFTGHLDRMPAVSLVTDEARSTLVRSQERFDIIQAALVDTAAATSAGAYAFIENGLYTTEAWKILLQRLKPKGILSFTRWYYGDWYYGHLGVPAETFRLVVLGAAAVRALGNPDPLRHILLVRTKNSARKQDVATLLVSPEPFSSEDLARAREVCDQLGFETALSWQESADPFLPLLVRLPPADLNRIFPVDLSPPTDDRPYFFFSTHLGDAVREKMKHGLLRSSHAPPAVQILLALMSLVLLLGLALVLLPPFCWSLKKERPIQQPGPERGRVVLPLYFAGIGLAFMFIEIGLIQRLSLFLGNPTFGFTVTLFGLLLCSGLGSLISGRGQLLLGPSREWWTLVALVFVLIGMERGSSLLLWKFVAAGTPLRILLVLALISLPGVLMGFPFPLGMRFACSRGGSHAAWYWAINGAFSIIASVFAMVSTLTLGISATITLGIAFYAFTALLYRSLARDRRRVDLGKGAVLR